ncbi:MAG: hypothetical protein L7F78_14245 [Syntrophales bacterium LBB04]|nr:hypothetical protein [Syntrophales bacterium LBB04]
MKAGKKSLDLFSLEESDRYYQAAYDLLEAKEDKTREEETLLIDLLLEWSWSLFYDAEIRKVCHLLTGKLAMAESLGDKARLGMFKALLGNAAFLYDDDKLAHTYLNSALALGEEIKDQFLILVSCAGLCNLSLMTASLPVSIKCAYTINPCPKDNSSAATIRIGQ